MKYDSFVPIEFKRSLIYSLVNRAWRICSSETNFQRDVDYLKCLFSANGYPERFVVKCVKTVINRKGLDVVSPVYGPERKPVFISLPYCGTNSLQLKRQLKRILLKKSPWAKLIIIFKPVYKLNVISKLKSKLPNLSKSRVVYKVNCTKCDEFYIGCTTRRLSQRINEHIKSENSALYQHNNMTDHVVD